MSELKNLQKELQAKNIGVTFPDNIKIDDKTLTEPQSQPPVAPVGEKPPIIDPKTGEQKSVTQPQQSTKLSDKELADVNSLLSKIRKDMDMQKWVQQ